MDMSLTYGRKPDNGWRGTWYECQCCPYGYHIDLDFVRYCESIEQTTLDRTGSIKQRKDRRKQRQSMEVLLGLASPQDVLDLERAGGRYQNDMSMVAPPVPPPPTVVNNLNRIRRTTNSAYNNVNANATAVNDMQNSLNDVVCEFERTFQRTSGKLSNNLPDVTAVCSEGLRRHRPSFGLSNISTSAELLSIDNAVEEDVIEGEDENVADFDTISLESSACNQRPLSPLALQAIRTQMALSLERTKQLEEMVKIIPTLQAEIDSLKLQNLRISKQYREKSDEMIRLNNTLNKNYLKETPPVPPSPVVKRDVGIMCAVLTRNVAVGHQMSPQTKTVSTQVTTATNININPPTTHTIDTRCSTTQTTLQYVRSVSVPVQTAPLVVNTVSVPVQTRLSTFNTVSKPVQTSPPLSISVPIQTIPPVTSDVSVNTTQPVAVITTTRAVQSSVLTTTVASSDDAISDEFCMKCTTPKRSIGVSTASTTGDDVISTGVVSLAALTVGRSKSFHVGDQEPRQQKVPIARAIVASVGCQVTQVTQTRAKASQCEVSPGTSKGVQVVVTSHTKGTNTRDGSRHVDVATSMESLATPPPPVVVDVIPTSIGTLTSVQSSPTGPQPSRIPVPKTPTEIRQFRRQDTYTKLPTDSIELSGLDLTVESSIDNEGTHTFEKFEQKYILPVATVPRRLQPTTTSSSTATVNIGTGISASASSIPLEEPLSAHIVATDEECSVDVKTTVNGASATAPSSHRKRCVPSREMQAAVKVLNDSYMRHDTIDTRGHLRNAELIVQGEWFQVSSLATADPLDVDDYLDWLEERAAPALVAHCVNLADASGNTAMHYAVSHGNFDVVSILLDSKVCDINRPNGAGYTCVMLVSLAEMRSDTHANVVRRLFALADVNIRAKLHGQTALMLAVSHGRADMVALLLDAAADVNIQDEDGSTALMCAAEHGYMEIVRLFLQQPDCDSTIVDVDACTALKIAMDAGHRHIGVLLYAHERKLHGGGQPLMSSFRKSGGTGHHNTVTPSSSTNTVINANTSTSNTSQSAFFLSK